MQRMAASTAGVLVLAWLSGAAEAADPPVPPPDPVPVAVGAPMPSSPRPAQPASDAGPVLHFDDAAADPWIEPDGHFVAGAGVYLIKPFFDSNPAFHTSTTAASGSGLHLTSATATQYQDFDYDLGAAPLIWVGYVGGDGLGVRGRWWTFDQGSRFNAVNDDSSGATVITSAAPQGLSIHSPGTALGLALAPDTLAFNSNLRLNVWDLEATQDLHLGCWGLTLSGGARYVHMSQDYNAFRANPGGTAPTVFISEDAESVQSGHNFNGAGPTVSLEARRALGDTGLVLYGLTRGSLLFGSGKQQTALTREVTGTSRGTPFDLLVTSDSVASRDDFVPIIELEVGAEYGMDFGRCHPFIRTGLVGQTWFGAGNATNVTGNFGFLGLSATAGANF